MEERDNYIAVHPDLSVYFIKHFFILVLLVFIMLIVNFLVLFDFIKSDHSFEIFIGLILSVVFLIICFFYSKFFCKGTSIVLENNQIIFYEGIFSSAKKIMSLNSILDTSLDRSISDKLFNVAKITIRTAGNEVIKAGISNVRYEIAVQLHEKIHEKIRYREKKSRDQFQH